MLTSWQTTLSGLLAAIGQVMQTSDNKIIHAVGVLLSAVAIGWLGAAARQWNVTSEQSHLKTRVVREMPLGRRVSDDELAAASDEPMSPDAERRI